MTTVAENTGAEAPAGASVAVNPDLRWYIVHAYSGMEKAVERNIQERIARAGMEAKFNRILVPTEEVVEIKNGQRKMTERRLFPGYVFVEMVLWGGRKIGRLPFLKKKFRKSSVRCRKAQTSRATRSNSWWVN